MSYTELIPFDSRYRTRWMFPRNIRKIHPWKISQILSILNLSTESEDWSGNQEIQNTFSKRLSETGLKDDRNIYDLHSGGARTYISQLEMLGMVYKENSKLLYTIAGSDILDGQAPLPITQKMLLSIQYPSPYSRGRNVSIHPQVKIKPFLFFFSVLRNGNFKYLTQDEMQVLLVYGHNNSCLDLCISKIKKLRESDGNILSVIDFPNKDLYTPRTENSSLEEKLSNLKDDTNCFKNWLEANLLITKDDADNYYENIDYSTFITTELHNIDSFIQLTDNNVSFQRSFGAYNREKDTRKGKQEGSRKNDPAKAFICSHFYDHCGNHIVNDVDVFCNDMVQSYGFSRQRVIDSISPLLSHSLDYFASTYFEISHGGAKYATHFEKATAELFQEYFGYSPIHTGQLRRPDKIGGYADILLKTERYCALIDTKASSSYMLSHDDYLKMIHTYIPNYNELLTETERLPLKYVSYVAGGFMGQPSSKLSEITNTCDSIGASAITAMELFNIAKDGEISKDHNKLCRSFSLNKVLTKNDFR